MLTQTPAEKAVLKETKKHHKEFVKKYPGRAREDQAATMQKILNAEVPDWDSVVIGFLRDNN